MSEPIEYEPTRAELLAEVERLTKREDALEAKISEALRAFHDGFSRVPVSLINMINDAQRVLLRPTDEARSARDAKIAELEARDFTSFAEAVQAWQRETFPLANPHSVTAHLKKEAEELHSNPTDPNEAGDCLLLLIGWAQVTGHDLLEVAQQKFEVVQCREWGEPDEDGVVEHIRGPYRPEGGDRLSHLDETLDLADGVNETQSAKIAELEAKLFEVNQRASSALDAVERVAESGGSDGEMVTVMLHYLSGGRGPYRPEDSDG